MSLAEVGDAGFSGSRYTRCNNQQSMLRVWKARRAFAQLSSNAHWEYYFSAAPGRDPSDHAPLMISASLRLDDKPRPF